MPNIDTGKVIHHVDMVIRLLLILVLTLGVYFIGKEAGQTQIQLSAVKAGVGKFVVVNPSTSPTLEFQFINVITNK